MTTESDELRTLLRELVASSSSIGLPEYRDDMTIKWRTGFMIAEAAKKAATQRADL